MKELAIGEVFQVPYPFVRDVYVDHDQDSEGWHAVDVPTWKPGTRFENAGGPDGGNVNCLADDMGSQILTIIGIYQPPGYPTRVFFTRRWRDPDGKEFGKSGKLRILARSAFTALTQGYRHQFELAIPVGAEQGRQR